MTGNDRDHRRKSSVGDTKMAAQSQGIKQLMSAEKEAATVVANARKSELGPQYRVGWALVFVGQVCTYASRNEIRVSNSFNKLIENI